MTISIRITETDPPTVTPGSGFAGALGMSTTTPGASTDVVIEADNEFSSISELVGFVQEVAPLAAATFWVASTGEELRLGVPESTAIIDEAADWDNQDAPYPAHRGAILFGPGEKGYVIRGTVSHADVENFIESRKAEVVAEAFTLDDEEEGL